MPTEKETHVLHSPHPKRDQVEVHHEAQGRSTAPAAHGRGIQPRLSPPMKRGLLSQTCSGLGLALLMAFGLIAVAIPVLFVRLIVAIAVDGITWK